MAPELLNMLPQYSPWPARLMGLEQWRSSARVPQELIREFETEKWGPLWERVRSSEVAPGFDEVEQYILANDKQLMCWSQGDLRLMSGKEAREAQFEHIATTLKSLRSRHSIVELGAGYGQIVINLARRHGFENADLIAGEYTASGTKLIQYLAASYKLGITVAHCDLSEAPLIEMPIPPDSIIFTSYAAHYITAYDSSFIANMRALDPAYVVHFEPFYDHCHATTLLGLLQKKYIQANNYNQNLLSILEIAAERGEIEIVIEKKQVFGMNPLLPMSIVAWRPLH
jgi:hypothetical protein